MDWVDVVATVGFPSALVIYLLWERTNTLNKKDSDLVAAINELRKIVNCLAILVARSTGQDLEETKKLAGIKEVT